MYFLFQKSFHVEMNKSFELLFCFELINDFTIYNNSIMEYI